MELQVLPGLAKRDWPCRDSGSGRDSYKTNSSGKFDVKLLVSLFLLVVDLANCRWLVLLGQSIS